MKKIFYLLLPLLLASGGGNLYGQSVPPYGNWNNYVAAYDETGGKGSSADNPIIISSPGHLAYLAKMVNEGTNYSKNKYFKLTVSFSLSQHYWIPIGLFGSGEADETKQFNGHFDGNGLYIRYAISTGADNRQGLFGVTGSSAVIENLLVVNCDITGKEDAGGLIGRNSGKVSRCGVTGKVTGTGNNVGGLIGVNTGTVTECYSTASVTGNWQDGGTWSSPLSAGGLIGCNDLGRVARCYATGPTTVSSRYYDYIYTGGLIGINNGIATECYAGGYVTSAGSYSGGLTGWNKDFGIIVSCVFDRQGCGHLTGAGTDDSGSAVGGIVAGKPGVLASGKLPPGFDPTVWKAYRKSFPQLTYFAGNNIFRFASAISTVPFVPANEKERADSVCNSFPLPRIIPLAEGYYSASWAFRSSQTADIVNTWNNDSISGWVNTYSTGGNTEELTLYTSSPGCERIIKFKPVYYFSNRQVVVLGQLLSDRDNIILKDLKVKTPCDASTVILNVETSKFNTVTIDNVSVRTASVDVSKPGITEKIIKVTSYTDLLPQTETYTVTVERPFPADNIYVPQRWPDVLAINNNFATNGGFSFCAYEWYKNDQRLNSSNGYILEPGGLDKTAKYTAVLTLDTENKEKVGTCPAVIDETIAKTAVWPNPVARGQTFHAETGAATIMQLFDSRGNVVVKKSSTDPVVECAAPDTPGQYILQLTVNGIPQSFKLIVE